MRLATAGEWNPPWAEGRPSRYSSFPALVDSQIDGDTDRQWNQDAQAHRGQHVGWPMRTQDEARECDEQCPTQCQSHRPPGGTRPQPRCAQGQGRREGGRVQGVPARKAGPPVPLGFPQGGPRAPSGGLDDVDDERRGSERTHDQKCLKTMLRHGKGCRSAHGDRHNRRRLPSHRDSVEERLQRHGHVTVYEGQDEAVHDP